MCSFNHNPKDCPMYECGTYTDDCIRCKWLKKQKRIAKISQIGLAIAVIAYIVLTINLWG